MLKVSHLNPEEPRQVVLRILMDSVQPYLSQAMSALFERGGSPMSNLKRFLQRNAGQLAATATAAGTAGGATSAVALWKRSLKAPRALGYEMGVIKMPLAAPILGGFVGLALAASGAVMLIGRLRESQGMAMAQLHAQVFSVMLHAEGIDAESRQRIFEEIKDRLIGSGLKPDVVESLFARAPQRVEDLALDATSYEPDTVRAVLTNAWQMARAAGEIAPNSERAFRRLCMRLNHGDAIDGIKEQAQHALDQHTARIDAAIEAACHIGADLNGATVKEALESLLLLDPLQQAKKRQLATLRVTSSVAAAAGAIAAVATGSGQMLPIIGQAYSALQAATSGDAESTRRLQTRARELLKHLGIKAEDANGFIEPLGEMIDALHASDRGDAEERRQNGNSANGNRTIPLPRSKNPN